MAPAAATPLKQGTLQTLSSQPPGKKRKSGPSEDNATTVQHCLPSKQNHQSSLVQGVLQRCRDQTDSSRYFQPQQQEAAALEEHAQQMEQLLCSQQQQIADMQRALETANVELAALKAAHADEIAQLQARCEARIAQQAARSKSMYTDLLRANEVVHERNFELSLGEAAL